MTDLFLILHRVRGEPAFDIATKVMIGEEEEEGWIIPTSGHRAYPYWNLPLPYTEEFGKAFVALGQTAWEVPLMPPDAIDHYSCNPSPAEPREKIDLVKLGLVKPKEHIQRRI